MQRSPPNGPRTSAAHLRRAVRALAICGVPLSAGCTLQSEPPPGEVAAERACREEGLLPGTAPFLACVEPARAPELQRAEDAWQELSDGGAE